MIHLLCVVLLAAFVPMQVLAARPLDEIKIKAFNTSLFISNEKYQFVLEPLYEVPLQITRHIIYTSTADTVAATIKRVMWQNKKRLVQLAPEEHQILADYMGDEMPSYVKIDSKKRSTPADENGMVTIPLADGYAILSIPNSNALKRGIPVANSLCVHAPFFTNCDNQGDVGNLKDTLKIQQASFYAELDSYKDTNNARANEMTNVLNRQRSLINELLTIDDTTLQTTARIASAAGLNAAQLAHGDYVAHAQITYLQRVTNSLLRFSNSMASTDPRAVVAQPSLTTLFVGYKSVLAYLRSQNFLPIVDQRTFNWTERPLPTGLVSNKEQSPGDLTTKDEMIAAELLVGFGAVTTECCSRTTPATVPTLCPSSFPGTIALRFAKTNSGNEWVYGPHHPNHKGIFPMINEPNLAPMTFYDNIINTNNEVNSGYPVRSLPGNNLFCVDFLGYKMLASFNHTPGLLNGIPTPTVADWSDCSAYMFRKNDAVIYYLYAMWDGVAVPFYSNCRPDEIIRETATTTPITYLLNYPGMTDSPAINDALNSPESPHRKYVFTPDYDVNMRHWISDTCYMNIEPQWIGMEYSYKKVANVTTGVPRGYKLNQFTINPAGELASSIEFVYTQTWAWVYRVDLLPGNVIVVDEASALDQSLVLFHMKKDTVVDESDSFFGRSNNGRDCIQKADEYNYEITSCFFQNIETTYTVAKYVLGQARTTGIARYVDKFQFSLANDYITTSPTGQPGFSSFAFTLVPKSDSDFTYSILYDENICPKLILSGSTAGPNGCTYQLSYRGDKDIFTGADEATATLVIFDRTTNRTTVSTRNAVPLSVYVSSKSVGSACLTLQCSWDGLSNKPTFISTTQKTVEIASASKAALAASVKSTIDQTASDTITRMSKLTADVAKSLDNIKNLSAQLDEIDFNVSKIVPYENFTELRKSITALIDNIGTTSKNGCASGPFGDFGCLLQDIVSTLIVIAVIVAIGLGIYCVCFKLGVGGKLIKMLK